MSSTELLLAESIEKSANINSLVSLTGKQLSQLMVACLHGNADYVQALLKVPGIKLDLQSQDGNHALQCACLAGHTHIATLLLNSCKDTQHIVNLTNKKGVSSLSLASSGGNIDLVSVLLHGGADVNAQDLKGRSALMSASKTGHLKVASVLIQSGANVNMQNREGESSVMFASRNGHIEIVSVLLHNGANVNMQSKEGESSLMFASRNGHCNIISSLLQHGAHVNMQAKKGWSSLMLSCVFLDQGIQCIQLLMANGANINLQTSDGFTALMLAIMADNSELSSYLLDCGADTSLTTVWGGSALTIAMKSHHFTTVKRIITTPHASLMRTLNQVDDSGNTPLMLASLLGQTDVANLLLEAGVMINLSNFSDFSSLHLSPQQIKLPDSEERLGTIHGTALDIAFIQGNADIVSLLLKHGAKVNSVFYLMRSVILKQALVSRYRLSCGTWNISSSVWEKDCNVMNVLFSHDEDFLCRVQCTKPSTLYFGCAFGVVEIVSHLIKLGVGVNDLYRTENTGMSYWSSFITIVCSNSLFSVAASKQDSGDVIDVLSQIDWLRYSKILSLLIRNGLDINHKDSSGAFALSISSRQGQTKLVEFLLKSGADIDQQDSEGLSSLMEASSGGRVEVCLLLLRYHANIDLQDKKGWSALMYAVADGNVDLVLLLLERGSQINMQDVSGTSPLMLSCFTGCVRATEILLQHGSEINLQNNDGITALMMSSYKGHSKIVELLIRYGADMNVVTCVGMTALRVSTDNGHSDVTKLLVEYGAHKKSTTSLGKRSSSIRDPTHASTLVTGNVLDNSLLTARLDKIEQILQSLLCNTRPSSISSLNSSIKMNEDTRPSLAECLKLLLPIARDWKTIGALLNLNSDLLDNISYDCRSSKECLQQMLVEWLKRVVPLPTWEELAEAVEYSDNIVTAHKIRRTC